MHGAKLKQAVSWVGAKQAVQEEGKGGEALARLLVGQARNGLGRA